VPKKGLGHHPMPSTGCACNPLITRSQHAVFALPLEKPSRHKFPFLVYGGIRLGIR
jgi:hypothetical protein